MKKSSFLVLSLLCIAGCATSPDVIQKKDEFTGNTISKMRGNELTGTTYNSVGMGAVGVNIEKVSNTQGQSYNLVVYWRIEGGPYISMKPGESLFFLADGKRFAFSTKTGSKETQEKTVGVFQASWIENATYENVPESALQEIANAIEVRMKVTGLSGEVVGVFSDVNRKAFQDFLKSGGAPTPAAY